MQSYSAKFDYIKDLVDANFERFRGGVEEGLEAFRLHALRDGVEWNEDDVYETLMSELEGLIEAKLNPDADAGNKKPRKHSVAWYIERHHEPVADRSSMTVLQACYCLMYTKHYRGLNEMGMDELCGMISLGGLLQEDNIMPRCYHLHPASRILFLFFCSWRCMHVRRMYGWCLWMHCFRSLWRIA